jgi:hypothetical protein
MLKSLILLILFFFPFCTSIDTITLNQSIKDGPDGQSLVSKEENFALGFFSPGNSSYRYLGIWYVKVTVKTVVWVANRNNPINGSSGVLSINQYGNLVLYDSYNRSLWSTNVSVPETTSSVAQLLDSGNLVLVQEGDNSVLWQSSDDPTDTLLPRIRFGLNRRTGVDTILTSWKSQDDPGTGDCLYQLNPNGSPQFYLYKDSALHRRSWPWPWCSSVDTRSVDYNINFVYDQEEISYSYFFDDPSIITRMLLNNSGSIQLLRWNDGVGQWNEVWSAPRLRCEKYGLCGPYSICSSDNINTFECSCLPGYEPKNQRDWYLRNGSEGCVRNRTGLLMCGNGEGFVTVAGLKVPDTSYAVWVGMSMSKAECEQECLRNCNCTAYVSVELNHTGTGCLAYHGELMDSTGDEDEGWELNVRADATEIGILLWFLIPCIFLNFHFCLFTSWIKPYFCFPSAKYKTNSKGFLAKNRKLVIALLSVAVLLFLASLLACIWLLRRRKTKGK